MSDHAPLREGGKSQAFDVEYQMPQKHASEVDSRGLRRSGVIIHYMITLWCL